MKWQMLTIGMAAMVCMFSGSMAMADSITLDESEMGWIREEGSYQYYPDVYGWFDSNGSSGGDVVQLGSWWSTVIKGRAIMRFTDLDELTIPAGWTVQVNSATLKLFQAGYGSNAHAETEVYEMRIGDWVYDEVAWRSRSSAGWWYGSGWGATNPNSSSSPIGSVPVWGYGGIYSMTSLPTDVIEGWLNGDNYGLRLTTTDEEAAWHNISIGASNHASPPLLEIDYTLVPEPGTTLLLLGGLVGFVRSRRRV